MMESPGAVRPLPPNPPNGQGEEQFRAFDTHEGGGIDGPPMLPPITSFNDESAGLPADHHGSPRPGPSSFAAATPPQSPGFPATSGGGKNRNPLTDLIDSEEQFVALMSAIIRVSRPHAARTLLFIGLINIFLESRLCLVTIKLSTART